MTIEIAAGSYRDRNVRDNEGNVITTVRLYVHANGTGHVIVMKANGTTIEDSRALPLSDARYLANMWWELYKMEA